MLSLDLLLRISKVVSPEGSAKKAWSTDTAWRIDAILSEVRRGGQSDFNTLLISPVISNRSSDLGRSFTVVASKVGHSSNKDLMAVRWVRWSNRRGAPICERGDNTVREGGNADAASWESFVAKRFPSTKVRVRGSSLMSCGSRTGVVFFQEPMAVNGLWAIRGRNSEGENGAL